MKARIKTEDSRVYASVETYMRKPSATGTPILKGTFSPIIGGGYRSLLGYDLERFYSRQAKGELLPFTPFDQMEYSVSVSDPGWYDTVYLPANERWYHTPAMWLSSIASEYSLESLKQRSDEIALDIDPAPFVQAAASKIYSSGADTLTFLAELHKTVSMFHGLVGRAKQAVKAVSSAAIAAKGASRLWLEGRYGWRPLVYDMLDFSRAISSLDDKRKRFTEHQGLSSVVSRNYSTSYSDRTISVTALIEEICQISVRGTVSADIQPPKFQFNVALTGWELIKFSFIVDWFINVGSWLNSLSFLVFQSQYTAAGGFVITIDRSITGDDGVLTSSATGSGRLGSVSSQLIVTSRKPMTVPLRPFANIRLDVFKVVDLVTIFGGALKGFSGRLRI